MLQPDTANLVVNMRHHTPTPTSYHKKIAMRNKSPNKQGSFREAVNRQITPIDKITYENNMKKQTLIESNLRLSILPAIMTFDNRVYSDHF